MLLDDSIELEYTDYSSCAESLPLNWDIELSKIWIPSSLLPSRKKSLNSNENKPFILYTLEKPDESKGFSVYNDESVLYSEHQSSSGVPSEISHYNLINNCIDEISKPQMPPLSENTVEWNSKLGNGNNKENSPLHPVNSFKIDNSLRQPKEKSSASWGKNISDACSIQENSNKASFEDLARRMAEILSEDEHLESDWLHENVMEENQGKTFHALSSIPPSNKDSLEELYYSDEDEEQLDVEEYIIKNLEIESLEKKPTCSIYTENSYVQEQPFDSFVNSVEQLQNIDDEAASKSFEETEIISFETEKIAEDYVLNQTEQEELEIQVHSKDLDPKVQSNEVNSEDLTEKIVEFPIAYKRPPLQEHTNKTKFQKEKKKPKKAKINIPLDELFNSEEVDRFKVPQVDEFYENLVRQGKCEPLIQEPDVVGFPDANFLEKLETNGNKFLLTDSPERLQTNLFWDSAQNFIHSLDIEPLSTSSQKKTKNENSEPELKSNVSLETVVIENIPLDISKETIESFILGYGELKNLIIEQHGNCQKAKIQMDFNCEVDWIIDCLNDSQPFGSFDGEPLKCYRQT